MDQANKRLKWTTTKQIEFVWFAMMRHQVKFWFMENYVSFNLYFKDNIMVFQVAKHARRSSSEQFKEP